MVEASDLKFNVQSAAIVNGVDIDISMMDTTGILVEIQVVNKGDELKLWPSVTFKGPR